MTTLQIIGLTVGLAAAAISLLIMALIISGKDKRIAERKNKNNEHTIG